MPLLAVAVAIAGAVSAYATRPVVATAAAAVALAPGAPAPPFVRRGSDGRTYRLADYRGKQAVVLAWFAKTFTGG